MQTQSPGASAPFGFTVQEPRRHLAKNVVCMFADDRPPVVNVRRRGRLPRAILPFRRRPLAPGEIVEMCGTTLPGNLGKRVRIMKHVPPGNGYESDGYEIEAVADYIDVNAPSGRKDEIWRVPRAFATTDSLRRV